MGTETTIAGGCHCGRVRFSVNVDLDKPVMSCNCSICTRAGTLLAFVHVEQFSLISGEDSLADYQFNKHVIHHLFCRFCAIKSFARGTRPDGQSMIAINARCLDGVDVANLKVTSFDGRSR